MMNLRAGFADKLNCDYSIFVSFKYNPTYVDVLKQIKVRSFNDQTKEWEFRYADYTPLISLLNQYGIPFDGQKFMWSIQELQQQVDKMQTIQKQDANVDASILKDVQFKTQPFDYQLEGIAYGLNRDKFLLADTPGLGKTLQSANIARLKRGGKHCLIVVGYKSLLFNWVKEIKMHTNEDAYVLGQRMGKRSKVLKTGSMDERNTDLENIEDIEQFFIITDIVTLRQCVKQEYINKKGKKAFNKIFFFADMLEDWCRKGQIGRIILDESHVFKNPDSDQTQALMRLKSCPYKIAMTGTPIMNTNIDLFPIMSWLGYEDKNYWEFRERYCKLGGFKNKQIVGDKNSPELHARLSQFMLRRLKEDVLDLPEKIFIDEELEMDGKQWAFYQKQKSFVKQQMSQMKGNKNALLGAMLTLRKITCHPGWVDESYKDSVKYERARQIIYEAVQNGEKVIVFSGFTTPFLSDTECVNICNYLQEYNPAMIIGDTKDRLGQVEKFQNDDSCKIIVGSIGAMGVGLTLNKASTVIFLDEPWNRAIKDQAVDRAHRVGTKHTVRIYTLMCKDTVDLGVHKTVYKKGRLADQIVDGVTVEELEDILSQ